MINILLSRAFLAKPYIFNQVKKYVKSTDKVAVLAFSFFPSDYPTLELNNQDYEKGGEYYNKIIDSFIPYGISETSISWIHYYKDNHDSAVKKIKNADIIYLPGGAPDLMMQRINEFELKSTLEKQDKVYIGSSAGTMIQFRNYHISKDHDYTRFSYEEGLNLISGLSVEVHYRRKKNQKRAVKKVSRAYHHDIYGIPDDGAMIIHQKQIILVNTARQIYCSKGVVK